MFRNYAYGIKIDRSEKKGRGVFATKNINKGEWIIVEMAVATAYDKKDDMILLSYNKSDK